LKILCIERENTAIALQFRHPHQASISELYPLICVLFHQSRDCSGMFLKPEWHSDKATVK
jgi:hypothetical protein